MIKKDYHLQVRLPDGREFPTEAELERAFTIAIERLIPNCDQFVGVTVLEDRPLVSEPSPEQDLEEALRRHITLDQIREERDRGGV